MCCGGLNFFFPIFISSWMISVGSRDGRKGLGLGFGVEGEMEETELEEGEAGYQNNDDDATIDPDVALSYIDEKLHDVLGHFQKDFEGGVSAENLGAKFGGYGSFLPTYQRSPACTHPRSPPRVQNHNASISPSNLHMEGGRQSSVISSSSSQLARPGPASANVASLPALRGPPVNDTLKREVCLSSTRRHEDTSKGDPVNKSGNASDQKTLKVRIKMGSDNLSTRKNAEIYSGLGLDVSPSSSLECSPTDSEGFSREPLDAPYESPTSILQIMTSFPVHGSLLLSPLPYDLTCLTDKEKLRGDGSGPMLNWSQGSTVTVVNGSDSGRVDQKVSGEKKLKPFGSNLVSAESMNSNGDDAGKDIHVMKKETDIDTLACEELVSNALRLPLLSNLNCDDVEFAKGNFKADNIITVANNSGMLAKEESLEPVSTWENGLVEKPSRKDSSVRKVWENKKVNSDDEDSVYSMKGGKETDISAKADSSGSKSRNSLNTEPVDHLNPKAAQKATSLEKDRLKLAPVKETSSSGGKKKSKGSQIHGAQHAEVSKDSLKNESSSVSKSRKSNYVNGYISKSDVEDSKKECGTTKERYREFFGELELEQEDSEMALEEKSFGDRAKDSAILEKSTLEINGGSKERLNGKRNPKPLTSVYPRAGPHMAPFNGNGPVSDAAATVTPLVQEDWVCCDKCQKWRLLPLGTNPDSLPENWLCSMLNWLPGMNRCSISEEETTKALIALYHVPGPENLSSAGGVLPGVFAADPLQFHQNYQHLGSRGLPAGGKKKHGSKDAANEMKQDCLAESSHSIKKSLQIPVRSMGLNGVNQSPTLNGVDFQDSSQSRSLVVEKHRQKQKEKNKEKYMDGGEHSKMRNKRDADQDGSKASKKTKTGGMHYADEDWASDHGEAVLKGRSSSSGLSINGLVKDCRKYKNGSEDSKSDSKGAVRNQEHQNQVTPNDGSHKGKCDERDIAKKRKLNDYQDSQIYNKPLPGVGRDLQESSETNHRKEKKAKVSKSRGEETCASKDTGGADKRGRAIKDEQVGSLDAIDSSKRDAGSVAATSSSSKVSGSHKTKANPQEVKGSPVESVSSSPLRILNPDKFITTKGSDGEDDRGSYRAFGKDETLTGANGSLESSVLDFQERDLVQPLGNKGKAEVLPSPEFATCHVTDGDADNLGQGGPCGSRPETLDEGHNEERWNDKQGLSNGSHPRKPGKASSSRSKDKSRSSRSEYDKVNLKITDSSNDYGENSKAGRNKLQEKFSVGTDKVEKGSVSKKGSSGKLSSENVKRDSYSKYGRTDGSDVKKDAISSQDAKQNQPMDRDGERSSKRVVSDKTDRADVSGRGKSHSLPPSGRGQNETARLPQPVPGSQKENGGISSSIDASEGNDPLRAPKQNKKAENQNGNQPTNMRHSTPNRHKVKDHDAPSPLRRDSSSQAATNALKEAKDLKHLADRLKNSGSNLESTGYYFQAALKFLHGASLLESCNSESSKHGEMAQSMTMYSSTAKLCEFCAHEYEKSKDMAGAALAYKCTEVAYLKVVYSSHNSASKDRHELQTALQIVPTGESPSSSASDLDNLNNPATVDKVALAKGVSPPQVAGNHVIAARNRPNFVRLLGFAQNVNLAMEASRKSRIAFAASNFKPEDKEAISSVKKALDFNFQDVEGLLRLVRLAMETISR